MLNWQPAPTKTVFGAGMVITSVEIDKDHTLTMYCEEDQKDKVLDALLTLVMTHDEDL